MAPTTQNLALIFTKVPSHMPVPSEHVQVQDTGAFDIDQPLPQSGGLILETLYASFDPYLRGLLRDPSIKSYMPAVPLGKPISAATLSRVLRSNIEGYTAGDVVRLVLPIQQYNVYVRPEDGGDDVEWQKPFKVPTSPDDVALDVRHYLGALGMPGLTAYSSFYEIGKPKRGETIVVSSAAGAVGQIVGQLAKHEGLTVLGSVGSDDKLEFIVNELGFDGGWNYKAEKSTKGAIERLVREQRAKQGGDTKDATAENSPGIDIFYDNVGGEQLDGAFECLNLFGRIIECGQISQYNLPPQERYPIRNTFQTVAKRLTMRGFMVGDADMGPKHEAAHIENVSRWLRDGSFRAKIHATVGMERAAEAFVGMLKGENFGKAILKVKV
ncbi:Zinc-type alcohol dehydrogenase-like protein PB24D3.08c [Cladophialophora carrionii]|uniref:Zinc-type alcohol dehydrogenase-like protein PB24D3.08c n=1 Tax=Cladophialophora carrionii TaxID=86049 RepID=A0A1C1CG91_9EURO|nr:Zinc-type alcohol dehydrogenase-like protein PB24D3.08c [Cladophialophora carrionii]